MMELHAHVIILVLLAAYTAALVWVIGRRMHALRDKHVCADVSAPLAALICDAMDAKVLAALERSALPTMDVTVFDADGKVVASSRTPVGGKVVPPNEVQRGLLEAVGGADATARTVRRMRHDGGRTRSTHVACSRSTEGLLVVLESDQI